MFVGKLSTVEKDTSYKYYVCGQSLYRGTRYILIILCLWVNSLWNNTHPINIMFVGVVGKLSVEQDTSYKYYFCG